jgi:hypothetical protein
VRFDADGRCCLTILVLLLGGCSRDLSRGHAADLITKDEKFVEPMTVNVPIGQLWFDDRNIYDAYPLLDLQSAGLITVSETGRTHGVWTK